MAISLFFVVSLMFSSRSVFVKFSMVVSWSFICWFLGRIIVPVEGFMFSISWLMLMSHGDGFTFPVC